MDPLTKEQVERLEECSESLDGLAAELEDARSPEEVSYVRGKVRDVISEIQQIIG